MATTPAPEYVLGTDAVELERLGVQHRLWADAAHRLWRRASITTGSRVLDVGAGPGYPALDLAQLVGPTGRVVAIDESPGFIAEANRRAAALALPHFSAHEGDAMSPRDALPDDATTFDAAYARWVLCFVPDPGAVVSAVASLLAPGGRFAVQDYFNYTAMTLAPRDARFDTVIDAVDRSWRDRGGDPNVAGRLPALFDSAGLELEHIRVDQRIARPGEPMWAWPTTFWESVIPRLISSGHLEQRDADDFLGLWSERSRDPAAFIHLPPVYELIARKPA